MRALGVASAVVVLLAGCAGTAPSAAPSVAPVPTSAAPSVAACPASGLLVTAARGEAAAGYREMTLYVANCGAEVCTIQGRPDIVVLDDKQNPLPVKVVPNVFFTASPRKMTLKPGTRAMATLSWHSTVTTGEVATGVFLSVAPVAGVQHQIVTLPAPLDLGTTGRLEASAWL
jgi:hypothetical protein